MKKIILLFFCALFLKSLTISQINFLHLKISLPKKEYLKCEPIFLNNYLINESKTEIKTKKVYPGLYYKIRIQDIKGNVFPSLLPEKVDWTDTNNLSLTLEPNDSAYQRFELLSHYSPARMYLGQLTTEAFFPVGKYKIYSTLETGYGLISSNQIEIEVVEPKGEDIEALNILKEATGFWWSDNKKSLNILNSLIEKYPKSIYKMQALRQIMYMYNYTANNEELDAGYKAAISVIESYPKSEVADDALTYIFFHGNKIKPEDEMKKVLLEIEKKYPDTEIGKRAAKKLKWYESNNSIK